MRTGQLTPKRQVSKCLPAVEAGLYFLLVVEYDEDAEARIEPRTGATEVEAAVHIKHRGVGHVEVAARARPSRILADG